MLERVHPQTLVVNDPCWVRNYPEKILVTEFTDLTPPTLITRDLDDIKAFNAEFGDMILKPLYGNGGAGVFRIGANGQNLSSLHEMFCETWPESFIAQAFLKDVVAGDKRVILVDGEPMWAGGPRRSPCRIVTARYVRPSVRCCARKGRSSLVSMSSAHI